jgi:hypothetical protein
LDLQLTVALRLGCLCKPLCVSIRLSTFAFSILASFWVAVPTTTLGPFAPFAFEGVQDLPHHVL